MRTRSNFPILLAVWFLAVACGDAATTQASSAADELKGGVSAKASRDQDDESDEAGKRTDAGAPSRAKCDPELGQDAGRDEDEDSDEGKGKGKGKGKDKDDDDKGSDER